MTMSGDSSARTDAQQRIIDRAMRDPGFRARLLENPEAAIEEELGTSISSAATIRVIEEQPGEVILVLPARPMKSGAVLSDEELERAAGGLTESTCATACGTCSGQSTCTGYCPH